MSDLLVSFGNAYNGRQLLSILKLPYGAIAAKGQGFDFPWGSVAVLEERLADGKNVVTEQGKVTAWVGDLTTEMTADYVGALADRLTTPAGDFAEPISLETDEVLGRLDGAFTVLSADERGVGLATELVGSICLYAGYDRYGRLRALGTHQDPVALLTDEPVRIDIAGAAEFLQWERISYPHTIHENVKCLAPGHVHWFTAGPDGQILTRSARYWSPPDELVEFDEDTMVEEFRTLITEAVRKRCTGGKVGVFLSGGLDSRLLMALVPESTECVGLTFCDAINRESKTAAKVAQCYGRQWFPIFRAPEYIAGMTVSTVRLVGCQGFYMHAHGAGLAGEVSRHGIARVLSGLKVDSYLKCYFARDMARVRRWKGLLPPKYVPLPYDFVNDIDDFWISMLTEDAVAGLKENRQTLLTQYGDPKRSSPMNWLMMYPLSPGFECWPAERKLMNVVLPVVDRKLIDFCARCPTTLRLGGRLFRKATAPLYGPGTRIPNSNNGVRPGSSHWAALPQRAARRLHDGAVRLLEKLGKPHRVEHSWHDYETYWSQSSELDRLRRKYAPRLDQLNGTLFKDSGALLLSPQTHWSSGLLLLQMAIWLDLQEEYQAEVSRIAAAADSSKDRPSGL